MSSIAGKERVEKVSADRWSAWVTNRRFGGDDEAKRKTDQFLEPIREHVLSLARIRPGDRVLDIASRDGYIALGAIERVGDEGRVTFTERSEDLLKICREQVRAAGLEHRAEFRILQPEALDEVPDSAFDVVLMRSLLNYVPDKAGTIRAFHRVLKPGGRFAFVQMYATRQNPGEFNGYRLPAVADLTERVQAVFEGARPQTYSDFDERDLLGWIEGAGFAKVDLHHEIEISDTSDWPVPDWERAQLVAAGPDQPSMIEAISTALTPDEAGRFIAALRPEVEGGRRGVRFPKTYGGAVRSGTEAAGR